ncbi:MAG: 2OG-Fe(II) oxygenase [Hyphomicrobiaceae bacterium]
MGITPQDIEKSMLSSFNAGKRGDSPYPHWFLDDCFPAPAIGAINDLPFAAPDLGGVSGKREVHNATRCYFDADNRKTYPIVSAVSEALQSEAVTTAVEATFGSALNGSYLRIEYAQDTDGFWLEPHTDLGVKLFTCLLYLSDEPGHAELGTDIYDQNKTHVGRSPFAPNAAMVFVPSDVTFHGFEARHIPGVRKSLIINYVTDEWRAREQLAFPDQPIVR